MSKIKEIQDNLNATHSILASGVGRLVQRGHHIDQLEECSEQLLNSSETFIQSVVPWYKRCCCFSASLIPRWWLRSFEKREEELVQQIHRTVIVEV